ncbi:MAG: carboxypeptidase-like regulatory domain-containing protein [Bacteroidia bacterium]|nr:carboxypeptidase-like regulatory domain-containing protein [Bacteroidia bacterium]
MKYFFITALLLLSFWSCKKEDKTAEPTSLSITVTDTSSNAVSDAEVKLYSSKSAYYNDTGAVKTGKTDATGKILFEPLDAILYYIRVTKGNLNNSTSAYNTIIPLISGTTMPKPIQIYTPNNNQMLSNTTKTWMIADIKTAGVSTIQNCDKDDVLRFKPNATRDFRWYYNYYRCTGQPDSSLGTWKLAGTVLTIDRNSVVDTWYVQSISALKVELKDNGNTEMTLIPEEFNK